MEANQINNFRRITMTIFKLTTFSKLQLPAKVLLSILAASLCLGTSDRASASDTCKNARIEIINGTPDNVEVLKFEYRDKDKKKFRQENLLGFNGSDIIKPKDTMPYLRDLEQIGGDETYFRVTYRHRFGSLTSITKVITSPMMEVGSLFTCQNNGGPYRIILTK
jgi:hypothetical protein